jgi:hypothetical protein
MALDNNYNGLTKLKDWWGKVKANFTYLDERISTIITTPAEGVSAQEIIDARKGELALGDKIDALDLADSELFNKIGNLSNLTTIEKTNLVGAVSEVKNEVTSHEAEHSYLQEEEPTNVNPTTLWFAIGSEVNFSGGGVAIQNAETSDTPPETNIWFKPI